MPEKKLKDLHVGKTILDLKQYYDLSTLGPRKSTQLCNTALKLYSAAEQYQKDGDEEYCYISIMKFLGLVTKIKASKDYKEDKKYILSMLGPKKTEMALEWAERLSDSLQIRYKLQEESERPQLVHKGASENDLKPSSETFSNDVNSTESHGNGVEETRGLSISCMELYKLLYEGKKKILIFDVRPASDYNNSRMMLTPTLNVPENVVEKGMSAFKLEAYLSDEAKELYKTRGLVDSVVLMDWSSPDHKLPPNNKLSILKSILTEWDPGVVYKHEPLVLQGGYQEWLYTYPTSTTNPNIVVPVQNNVDSLDNLLNKVEYVDFDSPPEARPVSAASHVPEPRMPVVDRSSKPSIPGWKSSNGSHVAADRMSKPAVTHSVSEVSVSVEETPEYKTPGGVHNAGGIKKPYFTPESRSTDSQQWPVVDRSSKMLAVKMYQEKEEEMAKLLHQQEQTADRSLQLTQERVDVEDKWEKVRADKEREADEELRSFLQDQEKQLLQKIIFLEREGKRMDEENKALRKALESMYNEKEQGEHVPEASSTELSDIEQRIRSKEEARDSLERKRKADAERRQKELDKARATKPAATSAKPAYVPLKDEGTSGLSGQMKRSHSFPNLAQVVEDESVNVKQKVPQYDRAIKPVEKAQAFEMNAARQRSWHATYGRQGKGLTGLKNLGNSCYMNSIIQCISNTTSLAFYFVEGRHRSDVNKSSKTGGSVVEEVAAVVRELWSGQYRNFAAYDLKAVLGQLKSSFKGTEQQDSHEFLTLVMDWLHEELNKKSGMSPKVSKTLSRLQPDEVEWEKFRSNNDSIIQSLFFGQQTSTVTCCTCSKQSVTYEPFSTLSLPLPSSISKCTLQECLRLYLREEVLSGWKCPSCKESREAVKKFDILRLPEILVVHLKRFHHDGWSRKKQMMVDFPLSDLNMKEFTSHPQQEHTIYNLYAVSNHYGTMEGGHYTAFCHNHVFSKWVKFDDQEVSDMSQNDVRTMAAYILFYESVNSSVCSMRDFDK